MRCCAQGKHGRFASSHYSAHLWYGGLLWCLLYCGVTFAAVAAVSSWSLLYMHCFIEVHEVHQHLPT